MADFEAPAPAHAHAHGGGEAEHSHEHANSHEHAHHDGDGGREHAHLHEHVDVSQLVLHQEAAAAARPKEPFVAPADRLIIPADAFEFSEVDEEVRYTGTSGLKITQITGLEPLKHLQTLVLRSCLISDMGAVSAHAPTLRHLELYDNQLKSLKGVEGLLGLVVLDVSFNVIRDTGPVAKLAKLEELYVAANKLRSIGGLADLSKLKKLDLGANRIRDMAGLAGCRALEHLFLGKNRIQVISGLENLDSLKVLDVQCNRLRGLQGVTPSLVELYVGYNAIGEVPTLEAALFKPLNKLSTLDLSHNRIADVRALLELTALEDLWMSYNLVPDLAAVAVLRPMQQLTTIYLEHNPCADEPSYVCFIRELLRNVGQVDANTYTPLGPAQDAAATE